MNEIESIILGIIQGLTEFLPVSSSGHLELGKAVFGETKIPEDSLLFSVVVHAATALSTIIIFRKDILEILTGLLKFKWNEETQYASKILLSMIPVGIVGVLLKDPIKEYCMGNVGLVGLMLFITGFLLLFTHFSKRDGEGNVTYGKAMIIGVAQAIAVLPGISRSGSTIATSILLGVDKAKAAKFSFLMVLAPIFGEALLDMKDYLETPAQAGSISALSLGLGFIAAFVTGLFACKLMIKIVKNSKLIYFSYYCFVVGSIAVIYYFI